MLFLVLLCVPGLHCSCSGRGFPTRKRDSGSSGAAWDWLQDHVTSLHQSTRCCPVMHTGQGCHFLWPRPSTSRCVPETQQAWTRSVLLAAFLVCFASAKHVINLHLSCDSPYKPPPPPLFFFPFFFFFFFHGSFCFCFHGSFFSPLKLSPILIFSWSNFMKSLSPHIEHNTFAVSLFEEKKIAS